MPDKQLEKQLQVIWRVADRVARQGTDESARQAANAVLRHFASTDGDAAQASATLARGELHWMCQTVEHLAPMVDIVHLLDALASMTAAKERRKISLDLHDGTIQPYLGLRLGLESLRRKAGAENPLLRDIEELCAMADESIAELRRYIRGLKGEQKDRPASPLDLVRRQAERFKKFYGMEVEITVEPGIEISEDLGTEIMQIVGESLSNIGRHTLSRRVLIRISGHEQSLVVQIINLCGEGDGTWRDFTPASITQRVRRLGGRVTVNQLRENDTAGTVVRVDIPVGAVASRKLDS